MGCDVCGTNVSFVQTLFMGATVKDFSSQIGYNGNGGTLTVEVVEDPCTTNAKLYYPTRTTSATTTAADKFQPPAVGSPVFFKYGGFEFGGILRSWREKEDGSNVKSYSVSITDAATIVKGVQVVLASYGDTTDIVPNLWNVGGYLDAVYPSGTSCPPYQNIGLCWGGSAYQLCANLQYNSLGQGVFNTGFGGLQNASDAGVDTRRLLTALEGIQSGGAGGYYGNIITHGMEREFMRPYLYVVNIAELFEKAPSTIYDVRFTGENMSLYNIVDKLCANAGLSYYYQLVPNNFLTHDSSGRVDYGPHLIKLRVSDPANQYNDSEADDIDGAVTAGASDRLALGKLQSYVDGLSCKTSHSLGLEKADVTTSSVLTGDYRREIYQTYNTLAASQATFYNSQIWPYWGLQSDGTPVVSWLQQIPQYAPTLRGDGLWEIKRPGGRDGLVIQGASTWSGQVEAQQALNGFYTENPPDTSYYYAFTMSTAQLAYTNQTLTVPLSYVVHELELKAALAGIDSWARVARAVNGTQSDSFHIFTVESSPEASTFKQAAEFLAPLPADGLATDSTTASQMGNDARTALREELYNMVKQYATEYYGKKFLINAPFIKSRLNQYGYETNWETASSGWANTLGALGFARGSLQLASFQETDGTVKGMAYLDSSPYVLDGKDFGQNDVYPISPTACLVGLNAENMVQDGLNNWKIVVSLNAQIRTYNPSQNLEAVTKEQEILYGYLQTSEDKRDGAANPGGANLHGAMAGTPVMPNGVAVPLQSKNFVYGPWVASAYNMKTDYERDTSLAPWNYGSFSTMDTIGILKTVLKVGDKKVSETGNVTIYGAPQFSLGDYLNGGPMITNVQMSVPSRGPITTTLQMKSETINYAARIRTAIDNTAYEATITQKLQNNYRAIARNIRANIAFQYGEVFASNSSITHSGKSEHLWITGAVKPNPFNTELTRPIVAFTEPRKALGTINNTSANSYVYTALVGTDGIFRPFTTDPSSSAINGMASYETFAETLNRTTAGRTYGQSKSPSPPITDEPRQPIVVDTLSPLLNNGLAMDGAFKMTDAGASDLGHDMEYVARGSSMPDDLSIHQNGSYDDDYSYRSIAFRGPPVFEGWGYTTEGYPVPNAAENGRSAYFKDGYLQRSSDWKVGPLDMRWDEDRKVWTSPQPYKLVAAVVGTATAASPSIVKPGAAIWTTIDKTNVASKYDEDGVALADTKFEVMATNKTSSVFASGSAVWLYYDTNDETYYIVGGTELTPMVVEADYTYGAGDTSTIEISSISEEERDPEDYLIENESSITIANDPGSAYDGVSCTALITWNKTNEEFEAYLITSEVASTTATEITCLVDDGSGVAPEDSTITVDGVSVSWPSGADAPSVTSVNNVLKWRIHNDNHPIRARKNGTGGWDALYRDPVANRITFLVNDASGVADTDTLIAITGVAVMNEPGASSPSITGVYIDAVSGATASNGAKGRAEWNEAEDRWECYWLEYDCGA